MQSNAANHDGLMSGYILTDHALQRMTGRRITLSEINDVLAYGRKTHTRGAAVYAIGRKEIAYYRQFGTDLTELDGLQVVCNQEGVVMTAYRNKDFRGLRPRRRNMRSSASH